MSHNTFDLTPLKKQLTESLESISFEINKGIKTLNNDSYCVLGELKDLKDKFEEVETMAASFYLNNYLSPYTDKYLEITTCIQHEINSFFNIHCIISCNRIFGPLIRAGTTIGATLHHHVEDFQDKRWILIMIGSMLHQ